MDEIYYKQLIKQYGLWYSPAMTAQILKEARTYNWYHKRGTKLFWKDIAVEIGISANSLGRIVQGKGFPSVKTMEKLVAYFDLNINTNIEGADNK